MSLLGNLAVGPVADRLDNRYVLGVSLALMGIGLWFFNVLSPATVSYASLLFVVLFGVGSGCTYVLGPIILANYFGFKNFATFAAVTAVVIAIFSIIGPTMAGHIFDVTNSYSGAWLIIIGALVVGIICGLVALPPKPREAGSES